MSSLSPRLQLKVAQKQILTPGLVQMVTVLQLNRMELKEMINQEIVNNPVLEAAMLDGTTLDGAVEMGGLSADLIAEGTSVRDAPAEVPIQDALEAPVS